MLHAKQPITALEDGDPASSICWKSKDLTTGRGTVQSSVVALHAWTSSGLR